MKPQRLFCLFVALATLCLLSVLPSCTASSEKKKEKEAASGEELVQRGSYLVAVGGCNDCHTPKKMTDKGPESDPSLTLSGHPAGAKLPPIDDKALQPGNWVLFSPDLTSAAGPWGISYAANLTSDSLTGIGRWTVENFINAMRKGKHRGMDNERPILPPMPWQSIGKLSDEDLTAIFAYLKTVPAVHNRVPEPTAPAEAVMRSK